MGENRNLLVALGLSLLVMLAYDQLYLKPQMEAERLRAEQMAAEETANQAGPDATLAPQGPAPQSPTSQDPATSQDLAPRGAAPAAGADTSDTLTANMAANAANAPRIAIKTPALEGSLSLRGAVLDDLVLVNHRVSVEGDADKVRLLARPGSAESHYIRFGWTAQTMTQATDGVITPLAPAADTLWRADRDTLSPDSPVTLTWDNGAGQTYTITIAVDDRFLFTVTQTVRNTAATTLTVAPYGLISRRDLPQGFGGDDMYILDIGPIGVFGDSYRHISYEDVREDGFEETGSVSWLGFTDKYWMTALVPDQTTPLAEAHIRHIGGAAPSFRADFVKNWQRVGAGDSVTLTHRVYAGAKIVGVIDDYETKHDITLFDRAIDWGWFYFLTRPIFAGLEFFFGLTGNFGVAILLLTVLIKLALFPLANKSYVSMAHMKKVQPKLKALQERHKDDKARLQQEMMALYQKEKINPLAGCLPIVVQIPVFFALYKVLFVTIEMRHQPFFGWIRDLSAPDPLTPVNLFGLIPWDPPTFIAIGIWPILMGVTMWLQQKLNPAQMDPTQQRIMNLLPIIFTFILANFAAGLVIYWTWNSLLSVAQQWVIMRREEARSGTD